MPVLHRVLLATALSCFLVAPFGCGKTKETVKTAKESPKTSSRIPPMPGK